jgi:hypothetical protein
LKITAHQLAGDQLAVDSTWPAGVCIQELSARIQNAESVVPAATMRPRRRAPAGDAVHAEQHHAEEGRLEEERGQHLVGEQRPGDVADAAM